MPQRPRQPLAPISLEQAGNGAHAHAAEPVSGSPASSSVVAEAVQRTLSPPRSPSKRPAASPLLLSATHRSTRVQRSARPETQPTSSSSSSPRAENPVRSPHRGVSDATAASQPPASSHRQVSSSPSGRRSGPGEMPGRQPQPSAALQQDDASLGRVARRAQSSPSLASLPRKAQRVSTWETRARDTSPSPQRPTREKALRLAATSEAHDQRARLAPQPRHPSPDADWEVRPDTDEEIAAAAAVPPALLTHDDTAGTPEDVGDENVDPWRPSATSEAAGKTAGRKGTGGRLSLVFAAGTDARQSSSPSP